MTTITEHHVQSETISFTGYTGAESLDAVLANSGTTVTLSQSNDLDLELKHSDSTLTLNFAYATGWPSGASITVTAKSTGAQYPVPCSFANNPKDTAFEVLVDTGSTQIVFDPKIKVIPPIRT